MRSCPECSPPPARRRASRKRSGFARAPVDRWTRPLRCSRNAPTARRATLPTRRGSRPQAAQRPGIARPWPYRLADRAPTWQRIAPAARIDAPMPGMFVATGETSRQRKRSRFECVPVDRWTRASRSPWIHKPRPLDRHSYGHASGQRTAPGTCRRPGAQLCRRGEDRAHRPRSGPE